MNNTNRPLETAKKTEYGYAPGKPEERGYKPSEGPKPKPLMPSVGSAVVKPTQNGSQVPQK